MTGLLLNLRGIYNKDLGGAAPVFDPASLFSSGEAGGWYDPSDTSTVWATTTATIQTVAASAGVTATAGNLVAQINDKSGNGNHATQATVSKRPILRQSGGLYYLEFDEVDDALSLTGMTATAGPVTICAGFNKTGASGDADTIVDIQSGRMILYADQGTSNTPGIFASGPGFAVTSAISLGTDYVLTGLFRPSGSVRLDGVSATSFSMSNLPIGGNILIGQRYSDNNQAAIKGNLYNLFIRAADTTGTDLTNLESYIADKSGVTL